ncbi:flagellar filament capping protein FliD [Cedecea neteri]|uniref:flagellar filament capping protein FliD n=1 Tax=Cedecea neteri TaxID=158822 RepID=UPI002AA8477F|nr:flagellar filament capping protein FliD [Cedecea neteri]WPU24859.1 flagellar filament capping protein FliD [Cedecea neteri]
MASISSLGAGTTLNLQDTYDKLYTAEQTKLTIFDTQTKTYQAQFSAFGQLKTAISGLETATAALTKSGALLATSVGSTNTAFSATTTGDAILSDYTINVQQMAKGQVLMSGSIASNTAPQGATTGGTRTLTITQPGTTTPLNVTLSDSDTSLNGIAKAINAANGNVSASVVKANDGDYRLMLTSKSTGVNSDMTVTVTGDDKLQGVIGYNSTSKTGALAEQTASQNAKVSVNGVVIERQSNTISDAMTGVTLNLKAKSTADETLSVTRTTDASKKVINDWVKAYNTLQSTIATVTKYVKVDPGAAQDSSNGALVGDSTVRGIQADIRSMLTQVQGGDFSIMAQLGISQDPVLAPDGSSQLKVDDAKLTKALSDNPQGVINYFVGDGKTTGFATQMDAKLNNMLSTSSINAGVIKNAQDGLTSTLKTVADRKQAMSDSIDATMARYKAQFTSLANLVSQMTNTGNYLAQQFNKS